MIVGAWSTVGNVMGFADLVSSEAVLANVKASGKKQALQEIGFTFAAYPLTLLSSCAATMQQTLAQLQAGQQASNRLTFSEIKEVLEFSRFDQVE